MADRKVITVQINDTDERRIEKCMEYMDKERKKLPYKTSKITQSDVIRNAIEHYFNYLRRR